MTDKCPMCTAVHTVTLQSLPSLKLVKLRYTHLWKDCVWCSGRF